MVEANTEFDVIDVELPKKIVTALKASKAYNTDDDLMGNITTILKDFLSRQDEDVDYALKARVDILEKLDKILSNLISEFPDGLVKQKQIERSIVEVTHAVDYRSRAKFLKYFKDYACSISVEPVTMYSTMDVSKFHDVIQQAISDRQDRYERR